MLSIFYVLSPKTGKIGEQQFKVLWAPEGATLYYWSDEHELPVMWLGGVETSCATDRGIKASGSVGHIDVWIPLERTNGRLQLRFTAQTEWQYDPAFIRTVIMNSEMNNNFANTLKAKAGVSALLKGGIGKQLSRDEQILVETSFESLSCGGGVVEPMYFFSIMEARDVVRTDNSRH